MTVQPRTHAARPSRHPLPARTTGMVGFGFVGLLLVSAGMASVPTRSDSAEVVRDYYTQHTAIVVMAQLLGLGAALAFGVFARGLDSATGRPGRRLWVTGSGVSVAAVATALPPLWLCAAAGDASDSTLHALVVVSDLTDVVLFTAIAAFGGAVALTGATWLRLLALVTAVVSLAHAALLATGSGPLEVVAPLAFVVLVLALSVAAVRGSSPTP